MKRALVFVLSVLAIGALALAAAALIGYYIGVAILIVWLAFGVVVLRGA